MQKVRCCKPAGTRDDSLRILPSGNTLLATVQLLITTPALILLLMNCVLQYVTHEVPLSQGVADSGTILTRLSCRENQFRHVCGCVELIGARTVL